MSNDTSAEEPEEIIYDLETLKGLLEDDAPAGDDTTTEDVRLLDDPIEQHSTDSGPLDDDNFAALLSDTWRDSFDDMFAEARGEIERNSAAWAPDDTDDLSAALKVRIDASVREWLAETLAANISRLRERVIADLSAEILDHLHSKIHQPQTFEDTDSDHG